MEMEITSTWAEFLVQSDTAHSAVSIFWQGFRGHMAGLSVQVLEQEIRVLDAYSALLNYEVNRPLLYWCGKLRPIQFKYTKDAPSRDQILNWKEKKEKLLLSDSQVKEFELAG